MKLPRELIYEVYMYLNLDKVLLLYPNITKYIYNEKIMNKDVQNIL